MTYYEDYIEYIKNDIYPLLCELLDINIISNKKDEKNHMILIKLIKNIENENFDEILNKSKILEYINDENTIHFISSTHCRNNWYI